MPTARQHYQQASALLRLRKADLGAARPLTRTLTLTLTPTITRYPETGAASETGADAGIGANVNVPWPENGMSAYP